MDEQNRFKKYYLDGEDYKSKETGAKAVKGGLAAIGVAGLIIKNKDNLKTLGKSLLNIAKIVTKK